MIERRKVFGMLIVLLSGILPLWESAVCAQSAPQTQVATDATGARLEMMSRLLLDTQHQLETTQQQLTQLRAELESIRGHKDPAPDEPVAFSSSAASVVDEVTRQREEQEVLEAEVKQHDQTKVESVSKYPLRVYGLLLFNAYSNAGVVDNADLPSIALTRNPGLSHGSVGGSFRQTLLGISGVGPRVFGARSSADISIDFFGNPSYNYYGSSNGNVRLRRGGVRLAWGEVGARVASSRDEITLGIDSPLISPLSPTSYASVANPELAWSGNLWTWSPQLQYKHTFALTNHQGRSIQLEGGLWDPPAIGSSGTYASHILSAGELSRRPGFLGRASVRGGSDDQPFVAGFGGFSDRQSYYEGQQIQLWAVTSDWQVPLTRRLRVDGEIYRGRGLGGLGGGEYKDTLTGVDVQTGLSRTLGLNAVGGWAQVKALFPGESEANLIYGQDGAFASDFRSLNLSTNTYVLAKSARNQAIAANFIYRPKTYIILSPEYRRVVSWQITGPANTANIFTMSLGYQF